MLKFKSKKRTAGGAAADARKEFFPEEYIKKAIKILRLLSDESRLRIMLYLAKEGPTYVSKLSEDLRINQTTLSHHLALLRNADLLETQRDGKNVFYVINKPMWRDMGVQFFIHLDKGPDVKFLDKFAIRLLRESGETRE